MKIIAPKNIIPLAGIFLSNFLFILNGLLLYRLTNKYWGNFTIKRFAIVYCFYPTTIINSSFYSESLFFFLILLSLNLFKNFRILSYLLILLSCLCRINGILYSLIPVCDLSISGLFIFIFLISSCKFVIHIFQHHIFEIFGTKDSYYFVQTVLWNQGFLKFYNFKKYNENILNFMIGAPFILIITYYNTIYLILDIRKNSIGRFLSFVLFIQTALLICCFHLQTFMRFVSTNPFTYWLILRYGKRCIHFFMVYSIIYCMLFCSYYPPT